MANTSKRPVKAAAKQSTSKSPAAKKAPAAKVKKMPVKASTTAKKTVKSVVKKSATKPVSKTKSPIKLPTKKSILVKKPSLKAASKTTVTKPIAKKKAPTITTKKILKKAVAPKPIAKKTLPAPLLSSKKTSLPPQAVSKKTSPSKKTPVVSPEKAALLLQARHRPTAPAFIKRRIRRNTPVFFSVEDVLQVIKNRPADVSHTHEEDHKKTSKSTPPSAKPAAPLKLPKPKISVHQAASLADILGFNPNEKKKPKWQEYDESRVQKKFSPFFKALVDFRHHVQAGLDLHANETLKRSSKDDSGDLSGYGQHIADAGTDTFDRDFALSLVSSEQDLLYEIDEAIQRIFEGTYGVCEITGEPINRERLMAVPFTRFSLEGQREYEKTHRHTAQRGGVFSEIENESGGFADDEDADV